MNVLLGTMRSVVRSSANCGAMKDRSKTGLVDPTAQNDALLCSGAMELEFQAPWLISDMADGTICTFCTKDLFSTQKV